MYRVLFSLKLAVLGLLALTSVSYAQIADPRILQLEEQVRQLTGQIEELNFQFLQLQEDQRKKQEDIEYRLQQLEDPSATMPVSAEPQKQGAADPVAVPGVQQNKTAAAEAPSRGVPPRNLGSITVTEGGDVLGTSIDFSAQSVEKSIDGTQVASLGGALNPEELYQTGYSHVLEGDYGFAEEVFAKFVDTYPDDPLAADARFWLGESLLAQGRFEEALDQYIEVRTRYPDAVKAPDTMLKIGTIMAALGNREVACATFDDALKSQLNMSDLLRKSIGTERQKNQC